MNSPQAANCFPIAFIIPPKNRPFQATPSGAHTGPATFIVVDSANPHNGCKFVSGRPGAMPLKIDGLDPVGGKHEIADSMEEPGGDGRSAAGARAAARARDASRLSARPGAGGKVAGTG